MAWQSPRGALKLEHMALRPCLTCQAMISTAARRCPQCGEPHPHATNQQKLIGIGIVLVLALLMFGFIAFKSAQGEQEMREFRRQNGL